MSDGATTQQNEAGLAWWQREVIYEIYPRSFQDENGDGIGDLPGIRRRLDYLKWLGVGALWIGPFYASPMVDFGYDISDHCAVDPQFGTLEDFDRLLTDAHALGIKIIIDFVPNHTSDRHSWFRESRASRNNPKRDWYIWRDPAPGGGPPNNWLSEFGESAWSLDPATGQYYYHAFMASQPDLNWRDEELRAAMHEVMRFWLRRGVDGFRLDAVTNLVEDALLRGDPDNPEFRDGKPPSERLKHIFTSDRPETHEYVQQIRAVLDEFPDRLLIGEVHVPVARAMSYYGGSDFHLPFNFELLYAPWDIRCVAAAIDQFTTLLPQQAWPNWVLGNHDEVRLATRIGPEQARIAAMLLLTLKGTAFVYGGDEIGLPNADVPPAQQRDPRAKVMGDPRYGRDGQRAPMPWDGTRYAGFTTGEPWLPLYAGAKELNVAAQQTDPRSMLHLYRRLIALRRSLPALRTGAYAPHPIRNKVLAYTRRCAGQTLLILLNFADGPETAELPDRARVLVSTYLDREGEESGTLRLRPSEGLVLEL
jgi:alpha-glucosidase